MDFENNPPILIPETSLNNSNFEQDQSPGSSITNPKSPPLQPTQLNHIYSGKTRFIFGPKGGLWLTYESVKIPGHTFRFNAKVKKSNIFYCMNCIYMAKREGITSPPISIKVQSGQILNDPDNPENPHICIKKLNSHTNSASQENPVKLNILQTANKRKLFTDSDYKTRQNIKKLKTSMNIAKRSAEPSKPTLTSVNGDFGPMRYIKTKNHYYMFYESKKFADHRFRFIEQTTGSGIYTCAGCMKLQRKLGLGYPLPIIKTLSNRIVEDPDNPVNEHFCVAGCKNYPKEAIERLNHSKSQDQSQVQVDMEQSQDLNETVTEDVQPPETEGRSKKIFERLLHRPILIKKEALEETQQNVETMSEGDQREANATLQTPQYSRRVDYGKVELLTNQDGLKHFTYKSPIHNGQEFTFIQRYTFKNKSFSRPTLEYVCVACREIKKINKQIGRLPLPSIRLKYETLLADPDVEHFCISYSRGQENCGQEESSSPRKEQEKKKDLSLLISIQDYQRRDKMNTPTPSTSTSYTAMPILSPIPTPSFQKPSENLDESFSTDQQKEESLTIPSLESFVYQVDVSHFAEEEIDVVIENGFIEIKGKHHLPNGDIEDEVAYKKRLPIDVDVNSMDYDYEAGKLTVTGKKYAIKEIRRSIPKKKKSI